ncbi:hypothetical protein [Shewanella gaetbuli]
MDGNNKKSNTHHHLKLLTASVFLSVACFNAAAAPIDKTITIATQEWAPYQSQDASQPNYALNALACVMNHLNQPYEVVFLPWGRAQLSVMNGLNDGFFSAAQNEQRDDYSEMSQPFIEQKWNFYLPKDTNIGLSKSAIKAKAIFGGRNHSNTTYWLKKHNYKVVYQANHLDELLPLLKLGRIDALMENELLFNTALETLGISKNKFHVVPHMDIPLGVYFGKSFLAQYPDFLPQFNQYTAKCAFSSKNIK